MNASPSKRQAWKTRTARWSANAVAAKARKRLMRAEEPPDDYPAGDAAKIGKAKPDAIIRIELPKLREARSFRVYRSGDKFIALGVMQAASRIGKRLQLILEYLT